MDDLFEDSSDEKGNPDPGLFSSSAEDSEPHGKQNISRKPKLNNGFLSPDEDDNDDFDDTDKWLAEGEYYISDNWESLPTNTKVEFLFVCTAGLLGLAALNLFGFGLHLISSDLNTSGYVEVLADLDSNFYQNGETMTTNSLDLISPLSGLTQMKTLFVTTCVLLGVFVINLVCMVKRVAPGSFIYNINYLLLLWTSVSLIMAGICIKVEMPPLSVQGIFFQNSQLNARIMSVLTILLGSLAILNLLCSFTRIFEHRNPRRIITFSTGTLSILLSSWAFAFMMCGLYCEEASSNEVAIGRSQLFTLAFAITGSFYAVFIEFSFGPKLAASRHVGFVFGLSILSTFLLVACIVWSSPYLLKASFPNDVDHTEQSVCYTYNLKKTLYFEFAILPLLIIQAYQTRKIEKELTTYDQLP